MTGGIADWTVDEHRWLAQRFEEHLPHLQSAAYRMSGSLSESDDAVQEAWLRLHRMDAGEVRSLPGWLTTIVARVCLDMLRRRKARREGPIGTTPPPRGHRIGSAADVDPEQEALLADSVGLALLVVLQTLTPPERLAFVLHDMFDVPFNDIAPTVGRSANTAAQLAGPTVKFSCARTIRDRYAPRVLLLVGISFHLVSALAGPLSANAVRLSRHNLRVGPASSAATPDVAGSR